MIRRRRAALTAATAFGAALLAAAGAYTIHATRGSHDAVGREPSARAERDGEEGGENEAIEVLRHQGELVAKSAAPFAEPPKDALAAAAAAARKKPRTGGSWTPVGSSPLYADSPDYRGGDPIVTSGPSLLGWSKLSGRITSFAYDPATSGRIFAAPAAGGVWETTDGGSSWRSIGDNLPTQAMGSVGFSRASGGTIIAATGDNAVGGVITPSGLGVYTSTDDGRTWTKAIGVPDGLVAFKVAVDPTNAKVSYVATNRGLFRSTDDGASYVNVNLPTPKVVNGVTTPNGCQGDTTSPECTYANFVTDVAVQPTTGAVIAALGWVAGQTVTKAGIMQAPQNGIYTSSTGAPGTFAFVDPGSNTAPTQNGFAPTPVVGRTTLAIAAGPNQDHNYVYALVQDATKLQGCIDEIDIPLCTGAADPTLATATYLDGAYVSQDFGRTWSKIMTPDQLRAPGTNSALALGLLGYGPGIQSWYNNWIAVDPTASDPLTHKPTRVVFGLEEIWENSGVTPPTGPLPSTWKVIGRYWNACLMVVAGTQCQNASSPIPGTTTHPDQHAGLFVPDATGGGVTLYAGSDGGAYKQHVAAGQDFSNDNWGAGINDNLHTLQPYDVSIAKDGTMVEGLQDNGTAKISPNGRQDMIFGGDGFFTAIDPNNSSRLVEEYTYGAVNGSTDGGKSWTSYTPDGFDSTTAMFATPLQNDPLNADHLMIGGRYVDQTPYAYQAHCAGGTPCSPSGLPVNPDLYDNWTQVYDLGTVNTSTGIGGTGVNPSTTPRKTSALDLRGDNAYVGWCGPCSVFAIKDLGFVSGIATNVGGSAAPQFGSANGWHIAAANGLPDRYVTSVRIDPSDPTGKTVYVTLGGYSSHWLAPGTSAENISRVGTGHVFVSHDAGENFTDVSGDLPDAPADWVLPRAGKLVVGTDVGVFSSSTATGGTYSQLGSLPNTPVVSIKPDPANASRIVAATFGRGVYAYTFQ
jgi:hypothetical protein